MPDLPTRPELFDVFANELLTRAEAQPYAQRLSAEQIYTEGSDINLIGAGASVMAEEVMRQLGSEINDLTLDGASGEALDRWVSDRYSTEIVRKTASPSVGVLQFSRSSVAAGAVTFLAGSVVRNSGGTRFKTLADVAFGPADLGPFTANAQAVEAGTSGNVPANTITSFVTAPTDATIMVTNPAIFAGGSATETDEVFRARARLFWQQARRGTLGAIEFGALTVPGVAQATAEEQLSTLGVPNGFVNLYIADSNGQSNTSLNELVEIALLEYRAGGIVPSIVGSVPTYVAINLSLSYSSGVDSAAAFASVRSTVVARVNALAPGETLRTSLLVEAARSIDGVIVSDSAIVLPAGDVVPEAGELLRTRADLVLAV